MSIRFTAILFLQGHIQTKLSRINYPNCLFIKAIVQYTCTAKNLPATHLFPYPLYSSMLRPHHNVPFNAFMCHILLSLAAALTLSRMLCYFTPNYFTNLSFVSYTAYINEKKNIVPKWPLTPHTKGGTTVLKVGTNPVSGAIFDHQYWWSLPLIWLKGGISLSPYDVLWCCPCLPLLHLMVMTTEC